MGSLKSIVVKEGIEVPIQKASTFQGVHGIIKKTDKISGFKLICIVLCGVAIVVAVIYRKEVKQYLFTRENGEDIVQARGNHLVNEQELRSNSLKWEKISMTKQLFDQVIKLSKQGYQKMIGQYTCPISMEIMRKPCKMVCCQDRPRKDKWAEEYWLLNQIQKRQRCSLCHSLATKDSIIFDDSKYNQILGFRMRLVKTYAILPDELKLEWKILINNDFGQMYTEKHLENFRFG